MPHGQPAFFTSREDRFYLTWTQTRKTRILILNLTVR